MYSLPITTYSDYWRATKTLSTYFGGAITLLIGACVWIPGQNRQLFVPEKTIAQGQASVITKIEALELPHQVVPSQDQRVQQFPAQSNISRGQKEPIQAVVSDSVKTEHQLKEVISKPNIDEKFDLSNIAIAKTYQVEATAYTYTGELTATGVKPRVGLIAVDPRVIPLGSRVYIEGYGYAIAADTGGAIIGNKVDVFLESERECVNWGRKPVKLYLLNGI